MPDFTAGDWLIGRSRSIVAPAPEGCDCEQCQPHEYGRTVDHYGGHCVCESFDAGDGPLLAQAKRFYEAAKAMQANVNAIVRRDVTAEQADAFATAWAEMEAAVTDAEKPYAPKPVRPAFLVK